MATPSNLRPPCAFNFTKPEEWGKWKNCFQQYRLAAGLSTESEERQVSTLLYCMGEGSEDVLNMTGISDEDKKYNNVLAKFDAHLRFERTKFLKEHVLTRETKNRANQLSFISQQSTKWRTNANMGL